MDYDQLKQALETPPITVVPVDPFWIAPLLPEDPEWPTPKHSTEDLGDNTQWSKIVALMERLPRRQKVLCALIAAESVTLPEAGEFVGAINLMRQWLSVRSRDAWKLLKAAKEIADAGASQSGYGSASIVSAVCVANSRSGIYDDIGLAVYGAANYWLHPSIEPDLRNWRKRRRLEDKYIARWWSECRRALCFSDAATASITVHSGRKA